MPTRRDEPSPAAPSRGIPATGLRERERTPTPLAFLPGVAAAEYFPSGEMKECRLRAPLTVSTPSGPLKAQGGAGQIRRKYGRSLSFYRNGALRSLRLEEQETIRTSFGPIPAELVVWHPDGAVKRIFPRNGRLSAYWTEKDEEALAWNASLDLPPGRVRGRIVSLHFYPGGWLKSLTLWPGEICALRSPLGPLACRAGFSLYEDGSLKSCEPASPALLPTPAGIIPAYDPEAAGVNADDNSLQFYPDGGLKALASCCLLRVRTQEGTTTITPLARRHPLDDARMTVAPLRCLFSPKELRVDRGGEIFVFPLPGSEITSLPPVFLPRLEDGLSSGIRKTARPCFPGKGAPDGQG